MEQMKIKSIGYLELPTIEELDDTLSKNCDLKLLSNISLEIRKQMNYLSDECNKIDFVIFKTGELTSKITESTKISDSMIDLKDTKKGPFGKLYPIEDILFKTYGERIIIDKGDRTWKCIIHVKK